MYIDISSNQGAIDWTTVKTHEDINGVILRSTTRNGKLDVRTLENYNGILQNLPDIGEISVYKFSYARDYVTACVECRRTINELKAHGVHFDYFYLDLEDFNGRSHSKEECDAVILGYRHTLIEYGLHHLLRLYVNKNYLTNIIDKTWSDIPIWLAWYKDARVLTAEEFEPFKIVLWQYTSKGRIRGITNDVDISKEIK